MGKCLFVIAALGAATASPLVRAEPALPDGAPGIPHRWAPAFKQAVGTAYEETGASSPVWFTVTEGVLTEVFYPSVDRAQVGDLQFIVTDGARGFSEQKRDTVSTVRYADEGLAVQVRGQDKLGRYSFEQEIVTDPSAPVVRIRTTLHWNQPGMRLFVIFKPAIGDSGAENLGAANRDGLFATSVTSNIHAAVLAATPFSAASVGYSGFSDGWQDLSRHFYLTQSRREAGPGNIALTGELNTGDARDFTYELAIGFGTSRSEATTFARTSLGIPFDTTRDAYSAGWKRFLLQLEKSGPGFVASSTFARRSAQLIKIHEDKRRRGAIVASLSKPAIPDSDRLLERPDNRGGYHLVWPRDLYHAAMGLLAAGDTRTPVSTLKYLVATQRPDGSWPQNFWVNGDAYWNALQMDEMSFPILLAHQLVSRKIYRLRAEDLEMVRKAASFIIVHGPETQQDRWEEIGGYVPSTLAAEIAALKAATALTQDGIAAEVADEWQSRIEKWTLTHSGLAGLAGLESRSYYLRASPAGTPDEREFIELANGGGWTLAKEVIDGGFLELVRLGIRQADDPRIVESLRAYEDPKQPGLFRRYNGDAYGPRHQGGFWPLLAGERGVYAVAAHDPRGANDALFSLEKSATDTGLLPEQLLTPSTPVKPAYADLGVACPLVWAHAEDIILHRSIEEGTVFDRPQENF